MTKNADAQQKTFDQLHKELGEAAQNNDPLGVSRITEKLNQIGEKDCKQPPGLFWSPYIEEDLEHFRYAYEKGDRIALFHAIQYCANTGNFLPPWTRAALNEGMTRYDCYYDRRLDESFHIKPRKDAKLAQLNDFARHETRVYQDYITARAKNVLRTSIYNELGTLYKKSPSTIRKWIRKTENILGLLR